MGKLNLTLAQEKSLASSIREFQRVKDYSEVIDYKAEFYKELLELFVHPPDDSNAPEIPIWDFEVHEDDGTTYDTALEKFRAFRTYFEKNWMSAQWLRKLEYSRLSGLSSHPPPFKHIGRTLASRARRQEMSTP